MKKQDTNLQVGTKVYWADAPDTLAGIIIRFTNKRDVVINFLSGNKLGERSFPIKLANQFIIK